MGREIINLDDGSRMGRFADADLVLNSETGGIDSVVLAGRRPFIRWLGFRAPVTVPWEVIRRLGPEVVLVELSAAQQGRTRRQ